MNSRGASTLIPIPKRVSLLEASSRDFPGGRRKLPLPVPPLTVSQIESYQQFLDEGIVEVLEEMSPITDYTGRGWELSFSKPRLEDPKLSVEEAVTKGLTYEFSWYATATLIKVPSKKAPADENMQKKVEEEVYMGELPAMTSRGTFIINGIEKVVVSQLTRSEGVFFVGETDPSTGRRLAGAKILPKNGSWLQIETSKRGLISVRIDRRRRLPITALLRVFGLETDQDIRDAFSEVDIDPDISFIENTLEKDQSQNRLGAVLSIYQRVRAGDPVIKDKAEEVVKNLFFNPRRYSLGPVGRFKMNQRLGLTFPQEDPYYLLQLEDLLNIVREIIRLNNGVGGFDDIDHLGNRRIRSVGELVQLQLRAGFLQLMRIVRGRMSLQPRGQLCSPKVLVSSRPVSARARSFFASGQLTQFQDQENVLAGLDNLRRLSVVGPGGLTRERASFSVRDAHFTHYGRICPVRTPEGQNVGLINYLALFARINAYGFLEAPYRRLEKVVVGGKTKVKVTDEVVYLAAYDEDQHTTAPATVAVDKDGFITEERIPLKRQGEFFIGLAIEADSMDVAPYQIVGISAGLIPFLAHDDMNRSLVGSNQLNQAVPLVQPQPPLVGTGLEQVVAYNSGSMVVADVAGEVTYVDAKEVRVKPTGKMTSKKYPLQRYTRSNQETCVDQRPRVKAGDQVKVGEVLADGASTVDGGLAVGTNLRVAYMFFDGFGYEDAIVLSEGVVRRGGLDSIHLVYHTVQVLETKLGPEMVTQDIPNVSEGVLRNLDETGVVRVGARVKSGDILVGKIAPRGEQELSAEERLLRAIFGEKAREVRDNSLRVPHGERGVVTKVTILDREEGDILSAGVLKEIKVQIAQVRPVVVGDKLAGRHGNKGVVSVVMPVEDMPHLSDGTAVDIIISSASVVSRMNVGQLLETHFGWAAHELGKKYAFPVFENLPIETLENELKAAGLPVSGKTRLIDGRTGEYFDQDIVVGFGYILKLKHMAEDKAHARSTGPYSLITQQPLGGKSQFGGQRFGEMEVWALEAYSALHTLQEMLTIKSDDILGRTRAYQAIIKGDEITETHVPESFKLLVRELNGLGLNIETVVGGKPAEV